MRGIIPLEVIRYIEDIAGKQIHQLFDLIAGTSTGGLLASALTMPANLLSLSSERKYSIDDIKHIYTVEGKKIFPDLSYWQEKAMGKVYPKYDFKVIEYVLEEYFDKFYLNQTLTPVFIPSYDIQKDEPVYFTSREALIDDSKNILIKKVCRATSAAPTYLATYQLDYDDRNLFCIDGGIFMNNPSLGALTEVLTNSDNKLYKIDFISGLQNIYLLSIGTGKSVGTIDSRKSMKWGEIQWGKKAVDLAMKGPVNVVNDHLNVLFQLMRCGSNYLRINVPLDHDKTEMSNSTDQYMKYWAETVDEYVVNNTTTSLKLKNFLEDCGIIEY